MVGLLKYQEIESFLLDELSSGKFQVGDKFHTELDIAARFNANVLTVRKAFASLVEKGLVVRKRRSGTFVDSLPAKPLSIRVFSLCLIGVIIGEVELTRDVKIGRILIELQQAIEETGYLPVVCRNNPEALLEAGIKGVITISQVSDTVKDLFLKEGIPVVEFSSTASALPHLMPDYSGASRQLLALYASMNIKHFAVVGAGDSAGKTYGLFKAELKRCAEDFRLKMSVCLEPKSLFRQSLEELLSGDSIPQALFAMNSWCLDDVESVVGALHLEIGHDISVVVHGSNALLIPHTPAYSIIDIDIRHAARGLVEVLKEQIANPTVTSRMPLTPYLPIDERGSLGKMRPGR